MFSLVFMKNQSRRQRLLSPATENLFVVLTIGIVIVAFFGKYTMNLQQTDTYAKWFYSIGTYRGQYKTNGRLAEWFYMEFFYRLMGEPQHHRAFHVILGILLDVAIIFLLWKIICYGLRFKQPRYKLLALLPVMLLRANVFYSDIFQFGVDSAPMFLGDLLSIIAALMLSGILKKRHLLIGTLLLAFSLLFRQTCLFWFVFTGLFLAFCKTAEKGYLHFLKEIIPLFIASIIASLPVFFLINVVAPPGSRGSFSGIDLAGSWASFCDCFSALLYNCDGVQPKGFYTSLLVISIVLNIPTWINCWKNSGSNALYSLLAKELTLCFGILVGTFFPVVFEHYLPHRTTYGFATLLPLWSLLALQGYEADSNPRKKTVSLLLTCCLIVNLFVNYTYSSKIHNGMVETNRVDQENARFYYNLILEHERETGEKINCVAWHYDKWFTWTLPGVIGAKAINNRAYCANWSRREILPFTVGRRFQIVPFDEEIYLSHFEDVNWDDISRDQIIFIDDTAYIVLY